MAIDSITGSGSTTQSANSKSRASMADNFDTFLSILTTQLKNQNPLDPLDTNQFTQQLVQFSGVEQQLKTNDYLEALVQLNSTNQTSAGQAMSLIGKEITVLSTASELKNGTAKWTFSAGDKATDANITISDKNGNTVYSGKMDLKLGDNSFTWDGKNTDGVQAADGSYAIKVSGTNVAGTPVSITTKMSGRVEGVDLSGAEPYLMVGSAKISVASILSVKEIAN